MPKTGGHDERARASEPASAPPPEPPRLQTQELHALVDDALALEPLAALTESGEEPGPASDPAPAELEIVEEPDEPPLDPPPPPRPDPYLGLLIDRRYEIQKLIAQGGMGLVYRCRHSVLGKKLAIKIIRADVAQMPDGYERFLIEAKAASAIGNEHIVDIIDFGTLPDGSSYLVMEYLTGVPLSTLMKRHGRMDVARLAEIGCQIAEGLGAAHAAGIVHRDLKPDNVFVIERKGRDFVKILDFGVARVEQSAKKLTQAGTIVGTPHYMSPEQATGKDVDHRGDIYALGVILYELCAGQVPFDGSHYVAVLHQHLLDQPPPLASLDPPVLVPEALERLVGKCLAKLPEDRYGTMAELARDLAAFCARGHATSGTGGLPFRAETGFPSGSEGSPGDPVWLGRALPDPGPDAAVAAGHALSTHVPASDSAAWTGGALEPKATAALPTPSPTLSLPRPSGSFTLDQKRLASAISLAVLLVTVAAAAWRLGASSDPEPAPSGRSSPAPSSEGVAPQGLPAPRFERAPATSAEPAAPEAGGASGMSSAGEPPAAPPASTQTGGSSPAAERSPPATPRRAEPRARRPRRATPPKTPAPRSNEARARDEFMNPWPTPR